MLVDSQPDMEVVAQAGSGPEAVAGVLAQRPHIAVMDVSMPDGGGVEATAEIVRSCPAVRVLALSRHADQASLRRMLAAGASGYVVKRAAAQDLIGAMRAVLAGGTYVDPMLAGDLVARALQPPGIASQSTRRTGLLSEREEAVLRQIAWGKSNKEVAAGTGHQREDGGGLPRHRAGKAQASHSQRRSASCARAGLARRRRRVRLTRPRKFSCHIDRQRL